jgi:hypothetical protein
MATWINMTPHAVSVHKIGSAEVEVIPSSGNLRAAYKYGKFDASGDFMVSELGRFSADADDPHPEFPAKTQLIVSTIWKDAHADTFNDEGARVISGAKRVELFGEPGASMSIYVPDTGPLMQVGDVTVGADRLCGLIGAVHGLLRVSV